MRAIRAKNQNFGRAFQNCGIQLKKGIEEKAKFEKGQEEVKKEKPLREWWQR